mmetsp:Transcript_107634/g.169947  ORF Transcript_107634/g.169947 Transcript_107634/m.169947 type:complete len:244 (-) Transcript_107634:114-845(-)
MAAKEGDSHRLSQASTAASTQGPACYGGQISLEAVVRQLVHKELTGARNLFVEQQRLAEQQLEALQQQNVELKRRAERRRHNQTSKEAEQSEAQAQDPSLASPMPSARQEEFSLIMTPPRESNHGLADMTGKDGEALPEHHSQSTRRLQSSGGSLLGSASCRSSKRMSYVQLLSGECDVSTSAATAMRRHSVGGSLFKLDGADLDLCRKWMSEQRNTLLDDLYGDTGLWKAMPRPARKSITAV